MPFITQYYLDLKMIDGTKPVKRRVVFFRRSTNEKLLEISKNDVPDNGIIYTTALDKTIPAEDIYAIAFDDDGNRQLAGADKLSIKNRIIWVDRLLLFDATYDSDTNGKDMYSGAPLTITGTKSSECEQVNGSFINFNATTPTISGKGLCLRGPQEILATLKSCSYTGQYATVTVEPSYGSISLPYVSVVSTSWLETPGLGLTKTYKTISSETYFVLTRIINTTETSVTFSYSSNTLYGYEIAQVVVNLVDNTMSSSSANFKGGYVIPAYKVYSGFPTNTKIVIILLKSTTSIKYEGMRPFSGYLFYLSDELSAVPSIKAPVYPLTIAPISILDSASKYAYPVETIDAALKEKFTDPTKTPPFYFEMKAKFNKCYKYLDTTLGASFTTFNLKIGNYGIFKVLGNSFYLFYSSSTTTGKYIDVNVGDTYMTETFIINILIDKGVNIPSAIKTSQSILDTDVCAALIVKNTSDTVIAKVISKDFNKFSITSPMSSFLTFESGYGQLSSNPIQSSYTNISYIKMGDMIISDGWEVFA